ncbi:serine/threonine protein kinase [Nitzschia inconspicua]|uniref:Serine/threonine protein kinase n=1 Tax=Nitzschia inconspicua TaxID=303405 RepID=A0A9K3LK66_9STRA|nr:serine/threonine protein kinase [Nitzschia inconspicua]
MSSSTRMLMTGGVAASSTPSRRTQLLSNSSPTSTTSLSSLFEQTSPSLPLPSSSLQPIGEISKRDKLFAAVNRHAAKVVHNKYPNFEGEGLPQFYLDEIIKGPRLGSGFFGVVFEVQNIVLRDENGMVNARVISSGMKQKKHHQRKCLYFVERILCRKNKDEGNSWRRREKLGVDVTSMIEGGDEVEESLGPHEKAEVSERTDARSFMKQHCRRSQHRGNENKALRKYTNCNGDGQARYAIKVLNPAILHDPIKLYYQGVMDINTETRLLSKLQDHPNICKLRAIGKCRNDDDGTSTTFHQDFFIVLDRLYHILDQRLAQWKKQSQRYNNIVGKKVLDRHATLRKKLWVERLCAAHGLASALAHLHSKIILHRDLKVDNIGFDIRGDVKLFDFGLARELPKDLEDSASCDAAADNNENLDQYLSTGGTHNHRQVCLLEHMENDGRNWNTKIYVARDGSESTV